MLFFEISDGFKSNVTAAEESMSAYKACKPRVDAVQQALNDTFKE